MLSFLLPTTFRFNHWNDQTVQVKKSARITTAKTERKVTHHKDRVANWSSVTWIHIVTYSVCLCPTSKMCTFISLLNQAQIATAVTHSYHRQKKWAEIVSKLADLQQICHASSNPPCIININTCSHCCFSIYSNRYKLNKGEVGSENAKWFIVTMGQNLWLRTSILQHIKNI